MGPPIAPIAVIAAVLVTFAATPALSGDIAAGRQKAVQCQACHGLDGLSKLPEAPHIAGQPEPYLIKALNDYRKGVRQNELMTLVVKPLTDRDVADIAAYYSAIEITAKPPR
jgi:cytochrome c553